MGELSERVLAYLPKYINVFGSLLAGPKRFIAKENSNADETFNRSLIFLGISLVLFVVMETPIHLPKYDVWTRLCLMAILCLVAISLTAIALRFSWWVVGGKASIRSFFVTYSYFFGVMIVLLAFSQLISLGFLKVVDPALYTQLQQSKGQQINQIDALSGGVTLWVTGLIFVVAFFCVSIWSVVGWGAYRELNGLSKFRSFCALMITGILSWIIAAVVYSVRSVMFQ